MNIVSNQQPVTGGDQAAMDADYGLAQRPQFLQYEFLDGYFLDDLLHRSPFRT
jgi:hypothetical protein